MYSSRLELIWVEVCDRVSARSFRPLSEKSCKSRGGCQLLGTPRVSMPPEVNIAELSDLVVDDHRDLGAGSLEEFARWFQFSSVTSTLGRRGRPTYDLKIKTTHG